MNADMQKLNSGVGMLLRWVVEQHRRKHQGQSPQFILLAPEHVRDMLAETSDHPQMRMVGNQIQFQGIQVQETPNAEPMIVNCLGEYEAI